MQAAVYPDAVQGDHAAITTVLRIQERRAKLAGLDKINVEHSGGDGLMPLSLHTTVVFMDADDDDELMKTIEHQADE